MIGGEATISWGGIVGGVITGDVTLANRKKFNITSTMVGLQIGAQGNAIATHVEFDPNEVHDGHYFTSIAGAAGVAGGTAISFAHNMFGKQIGSITFVGLGLGINLSIGDSVFKVTAG